jgi:hypothetical protein
MLTAATPKGEIASDSNREGQSTDAGHTGQLILGMKAL